MNGKLYKLIAVAIATCGLQAEPFRPANDAEVLERLPKDFVRAARNAAPKTLEEATHEAERHIRAYQSQLDPRYLGYAQAALRPWWDSEQAPAATILARARIKQSLHQFDAALKDINNVLASDPRDAQARLLRSTILQVQGKFSEARQSVARLVLVAPHHIAMTAIANIAGLTGRGREALSSLRMALADAELPSEHRVWMLIVAAEISERIGEGVAAETYFKEALALDQSQTYTLSAFADFLLNQDRAREAFELVRDRRESDLLLLRRALALQKFDPTSREFTADRAELKERFALARRRGDSAHAREEALALLLLEKKPKAALALVVKSWEIQREPADVRVFAQAAIAAKDDAAIEKVRAWLAESHLEDNFLKTLLVL